MDLVKVLERITTTADTDEARINDTLDEIQDEYQTQNIGSFQSNSDLLFRELSIYESEKPYDIRAPVMKFWGENSEKYRLLRSLANLLHAVPSNQSCIERSFSSFSYIRNKYRMSMSAENLSNTLMVRLNKDIFYSERAKRVSEILG